MNQRVIFHIDVNSACLSWEAAYRIHHLGAKEDLRELVYLKLLSDRLMGRIHRNYRFVMGFNGALIALGALGVLPPALGALLHNGSTLLLSMHSLTDLLDEGE